MKRNYIVTITLILSIIFSKSFGQTLIVTYDMLSDGNILSENFEKPILLATKSESLFVFGKDTSDLTNKYPYGGMIVIKSDTIGNMFYHNIQTSEFIYKEVIPINIVSADTIQEIEWHIQNETKFLLDYECTKADCMFSGRKYIAWFTQELDYKIGPWKLHGLPGTILEVYEIDEMIHFIADSVCMLNEVILIEKPDNTKAVSFDEYKLIYKRRFGSFSDELESGIEGDNLGFAKEYKIKLNHAQVKILEQSLIED